MFLKSIFCLRQPPSSLKAALPTNIDFKVSNRGSGLCRRRIAEHLQQSPTFSCQLDFLKMRNWMSDVSQIWFVTVVFMCVCACIRVSSLCVYVWIVCVRVCVGFFHSPHAVPDRLRLRVNRISLQEYDRLQYDKERLRDICKVFCCVIPASFCFSSLFRFKRSQRFVVFR